MPATHGKLSQSTVLCNSGASNGPQGGGGAPVAPDCSLKVGDGAGAEQSLVATANYSAARNATNGNEWDRDGGSMLCSRL